jgi:hypothetical protein
MQVEAKILAAKCQLSITAIQENPIPHVEVVGSWVMQISRLRGKDKGEPQTP